MHVKHITTCCIGYGDGIHWPTRSLFQRSKRFIEAHGIYWVSTSQWGSSISLEAMQANAPFVREALALAGHFVETHLGAQLAGPEVFLVVMGPILIEGVAPQSGHRGPLGIALLLTPGVRSLSLAAGTLGWRVCICVGIVALPEIALTQQMDGRGSGGDFPLWTLIGCGDIRVITAHPHLVKARGSAWSSARCAVRCPARGLTRG